MDEAVERHGIQLPFFEPAIGVPAMGRSPGSPAAIEPLSTMTTNGAQPAELGGMAVLVIDEHAFTRDCLTALLRRLGGEVDVATLASLDQLPDDKIKYDVVLYQKRASSGGGAAGVSPWLARLMQDQPVIIIGSDDDAGFLRDAYKHGARGFIPIENTTLEVALEIIRLVKAGGTLIPMSTLSNRTREEAAEASPPTPRGRFTPRELAVLDWLTRGASNKSIAYQLAMSESTVKVHIRNILAKTKARNRTEAVCRALAAANRSG